MGRPNRWKDKRWDQEYPRQKINQLKLDICFHLYRIALRNDWNRTKMAFYLGTSKSNVSLIYCQRIEKLTLNQLFTYLSLAEPRFQVLVAI